MPRAVDVPRLMLVTDRRQAPSGLIDVVRRAVDGGIDAVQVREKDLDHGALFDLTAKVVAAVGGRAAVSVNGSIDVAQQLGIGLHLPETGPTIDAARSRLGGGVLIGRSVHSAEVAAESGNADYLLAGHLFATRSKPGLAPLGVSGFAAIVQAARHPVLAIGGIEAANVREAIRAGAHGVAVVSAIGSASDSELAARQIRAALEHALMKTIDQSVTQTAIHLTVNGKDVTLPERMTIAQFLASRDLHERLVVVELNGTILRRPAYATSSLSDGDRVEIVHFVGGG